LIDAERFAAIFPKRGPILNLDAVSSDYNYKGQKISSIGDDQLVKLAAENNEEAFVELYQRYNSAIYTYIFRLVQQQTAAEDLLQETFVAAWQGIRDFQHRSTVKTWLFRIAHYKTMSWLRTYYRDRKLTEEEELAPQEPAAPDSQLMSSWQAGKVRQALDELSPNHRSVVELFYMQNLSYEEIAEVTECPLGTVKSRMSYAIRNLNGILLSYGLDSYD
jgi:RNA polymerase sigma-70 factor (ECF subfamily)